MGGGVHRAVDRATFDGAVDAVVHLDELGGEFGAFRSAELKPVS